MEVRSECRCVVFMYKVGEGVVYHVVLWCCGVAVW